MSIEALVKRTIRLWTNDQSIWCILMRQRYIKGRALEEINSGPNQSTLKCINCKRNYYNYEWCGKGEIRRQLIHVHKTLRIPAEEDDLAAGIWSCKASKMSILL